MTKEDAAKNSAFDTYFEGLRVKPFEGSSGTTMDDKIKAKAQEVRLALLEALAKQVRDVESSVPAEEVSGNIGHLAGILNQLDPGASIGSYGTLLASVEENAPPDAKELGGVGGYSTK